MSEIKITADIIDYLGKYDNGVLVLLSIKCDGEFTEGTFYYSDEILALTVDESIERKINSPIETWSGYRELIVSILKRAVPYNEIINRLDEIDFSKHFSPNNQKRSFGENVDESDISES